MHAGLVLAAGAATRMRQPKALLNLGGVAAIDRVCTALDAGGCDRVVAVLGAHADQVARAVPSGVEIVRHAAWERGQTGSVKAGLEILQRTDAVLVAPVDRPLFRPRDVAALLAADAPLAVPVHDGARGHPLRVRRDVYAEILALDDGEPLHTVVRKDPARVAQVPVDHAGFLINLDTPEDLAQAQEILEAWSRA